MAEVPRNNPPTRTIPPSQTRPAARNANIDPLRILREKWKTVAVWGVVGVFTAGLFQVGAMFAFPIYSGNVVLRLRPELADAKQIFGEVTPQEETVARLAQTEAQQMISRDILTRAVSSRDILKTEWHKYFLDDNNQFMVDDAVDDLEDDISAGHRRGTQFFALYWAAHDAGDVPIVLNTVANTYLDELKAVSDEKFNGTRSVFMKKQEELDADIASQKAAINKFMIDSRIPSFEENSMQTQRGLEELQRRIAETTMDLSLVQTQKAQVDAKLQGRLEPSEDDVRKAELDQSMMMLSRDINDIAIALSSKKERFGPAHPEVIAAEKLLESATSQQRKALQDIVKRELRGQFKMVSDRAEGLEALLAKQSTDYAKESVRVEQLASRVAELEAMKDIQKRMEEDRGELMKAIGDLELARTRQDALPVELAQKALTPRELAFPNWKVVLPGVWFLTLAFGVALVFLREFLDQRVRFGTDVLALTGGRLVGVIPDIADDESAPERVQFVVREAPQSMLAESFRQVWTQLNKGLTERDSKVVGVFTAMPEAGASTIITNLAASGMAVGKRVLVIDANFRKPSIATQFGLSEEAYGLSDLLAGQAQFDDVVQRSSHGVDVIGAGVCRTIELIDTSKTDAVMTMARARYDLILVDTAPAGIAAEAFSVASYVDEAVLIVLAMRDERGLVGRVVGQLLKQKAHFIGAVLNRPQQTAGGYYRKNAQLMAQYTAPTTKLLPAGPTN